MTTLVVGGDGNIDELGGGVSVAEGDDGNVDIGSLLDSLGVGAGVGDDDQTGLLERPGDVVGEGTGGEATGNGDGTSVSGELEDGTLTIGTGGDDTDVGGVVNSGDDTGGEDDLLPVKRKSVYISHYIYIAHFTVAYPSYLRIFATAASINIPGLANVDHIDTISSGLPEVRLHVNLQVLRTQMGLRGQEILDVLGRRVEDFTTGRHLDCGIFFFFFSSYVVGL